MSAQQVGVCSPRMDTANRLSIIITQQKLMFFIDIDRNWGIENDRMSQFARSQMTQFAICSWFWLNVIQSTFRSHPLYELKILSLAYLTPSGIVYEGMWTSVTLDEESFTPKWKFDVLPVRLSILSFSSTFIIINAKRFLPDPGVSGVRSMGPGVCLSRRDFVKLCWCDSGWWWYQLNTSWWC